MAHCYTAEAMRAVDAKETLPTAFGPLWARLNADAPELFGLGNVHLRPIAYQVRPFSHVLRFGVHLLDADGPALCCFAKVLKPKPERDGVAFIRRRVVHEFETSLRVHRGLASFPNFDAVRPVACYPDLLAVVTEEVRGQTLLDFLEPRAAWYPTRARAAEMDATAATVGRWIKAFQGIAPTGRHIQLDDLRAYLDLRLERLVAEHSRFLTEAVRRDILAHVERLGQQLDADDLQSVEVHADFAPSNVMVCGERVVVLDFAMANHGPIHQDIARLAVQVDLLSGKPQYRPAVIDRIQRALLQGYEPSLTPAHPLFRLMTLRHRINHLGSLGRTTAWFPTNLYNRHLQARHQRWITAELQGLHSAESLRER